VLNQEWPKIWLVVLTVIRKPWRPLILQALARSQTGHAIKLEYFKCKKITSTERFLMRKQSVGFEEALKKPQKEKKMGDF
jgi:hypothetical protein